ncbi:MAG: MFS transporter [Victivallales bacterium]|nr:MFS transporter [Victivallales bacterium]MCF7888778.1 MFS transporter [Victivallales bacterium]
MNLYLIIFLTTILVAAGQMANTIFVPAMTLIAEDLGVMPTYIQGFIAAYLLPYGISQFFYGPASDEYGRKPIIFLGLVIYCSGALTSASGNTYITVLSGCILQGIGAGVGGVMCRTLMRDCFSGTKLQISNSILTMALIFAPLLAPLIGGIMTVYYGWRSAFLFLFVLGLSVLIIEVIFLPETKPEVPETTLLYKYSLLIKNKYFLVYAIILTMVFSSVAVFEATFGILLSNIFKLGPEIISILFIVPLPFSFLGSFTAGILGKKVSLNIIIFANIMIMLISSSVILVSGMMMVLNIYIIIIPICFLMFGAGSLAPTATTCAIDPLGSIAGTAGAVLGGMQNLGAGIFTSFSSLIPQKTQFPLGIILTLQGTIMLGLFLFLTLRKVEHNKKKADRKVRV